MDFKGKEADEDDFLDSYPGLLIPCEDIEELQQLIYELFDIGILDGDSTFMVKNAPDNIFEILNTPEYFEETEVCGLKTIKGNLKLLERNPQDLL